MCWTCSSSCSALSKSIWVDGMAHCQHETPRQKLVTCPQGAFKEGNAIEALMMLQKWFLGDLTGTRLILQKLLDHSKDANGRALGLEPIEKNFANESLQFSFKEEGDDVACEISESMVQDVEKAAIELLAASMNWVLSMNECMNQGNVFLQLLAKLLPVSELRKKI